VCVQPQEKERERERERERAEKEDRYDSRNKMREYRIRTPITIT